MGVVADFDSEARIRTARIGFGARRDDRTPSEKQQGSRSRDAGTVLFAEYVISRLSIPGDPLCASSAVLLSISSEVDDQ